MEEFVPLVAGHSRDEIVICPPFVDIAAVAEKANARTVVDSGATANGGMHAMQSL